MPAIIRHYWMSDVYKRQSELFTSRKYDRRMDGISNMDDFVFHLANEDAKAANMPLYSDVYKRQPIALEGDCWYWTSTEVEDNPGVQAGLCTTDNGRFLATPKTQRHKARAIVEIYDPE